MDHTSAAAAGLVATFFLICAIVILAVILFIIWIFWRIFEKAGFSGALALLNLVPGIGHLICLLILAFSHWPIEETMVAVAQPVPPMPPPTPPGTSVMPS
jgi:uncharacterized membrane protein YhaH (DUF805 family)